MLRFTSGSACAAAQSMAATSASTDVSRGTVEHLERTDLDGGGEILNGGGNGGAVAEPVDDVVLDSPVTIEAAAGNDRADVRMPGVDAAVDDADDQPPRRVPLLHDAGAANGPRGSAPGCSAMCNRDSKSPRKRPLRVRGAPSGDPVSTTCAPSSTMTQSARLGELPSRWEMRTRRAFPHRSDSYPWMIAPLGNRIERGGRFVEHQHARIGEERAGNGHTLPLAGR